MCFYKASAAHLYTSEPLKLENTPNHIVPSTAYAVPDVSDHDSRLVYGDVSDNSSSGVEEEGENGNLKAENVLKSCIKKLPTEEVRKKRVQWKDKLGKELAEIKEFESRMWFKAELIKGAIKIWPSTLRLELITAIFDGVEIYSVIFVDS
ncbi:hypothetical protein DH2020_021846 [Rehmannia glutinosa]|uniref:Uncharacterized protein n=1 Tax=Rehmannia glutinosa TaxID=99300 RepID=A0ABR0WBN7_REHGL